MQPWTLPDSSILQLVQDLYLEKNEQPSLNGVIYDIDKLQQLDRKSLCKMLEQKVAAVLAKFKQDKRNSKKYNNRNNTSGNDIFTMSNQNRHSKNNYNTNNNNHNNNSNCNSSNNNSSTNNNRSLKNEYANQRASKYGCDTSMNAYRNSNSNSNSNYVLNSQQSHFSKV